ncbi:hypothetical protein [Thiomicrospira cyclica]|uniref:Uncharacterized protein n=1 Tax=Thiomicrospira cyclica (strain DSM 14477 / JCM 11371 / ALM1) TaxID=717773 RepID=F6DCF3_THICA|nr:hypothetical protein [Thiomicrospira cyclica]AEG31539.1 hypothetical protein Thicy_0767 [Thiomicrospira cyclica ALM1]
MNIELIKTSDNRVIGAQVSHHHLGKHKEEPEKDFLQRVKLFAENLDRLKNGGCNYAN